MTMRFTFADLFDAEKYGRNREAFLQTIPDEDREEVDMLLRSYDSTRNDCGLNDQERVRWATLVSQYPEMEKWHG